MFDIVMLIFSFFMLSISVAPLYPSNHWAFRAWEFPRVQIAVLCILLLLLSFFMHSTKLIALTVIINVSVLLYQCLWILPYTKLFPVQVETADKTKSSHSIKILTSNVLMTNHACHKLLNLLHYFSLFRYKTDLVYMIELYQLIC